MKKIILLLMLVLFTCLVSAIEIAGDVNIDSRPPDDNVGSVEPIDVDDVEVVDTGVQAELVDTVEEVTVQPITEPIVAEASVVSSDGIANKVKILQFFVVIEFVLILILFYLVLGRKKKWNVKNR
ncbi:hypothetical protein KY330_02795 [Candidatus Woesearchaeota archaeon]|nr:hypothetical protein [Candidatus Woesearchaeota archaeon]